MITLGNIQIGNTGNDLVRTFNTNMAAVSQEFNNLQTKIENLNNSLNPLLLAQHLKIKDFTSSSYENSNNAIKKKCNLSSNNISNPLFWVFYIIDNNNRELILLDSLYNINDNVIEFAFAEPDISKLVLRVFYNE